MATVDLTVRGAGVIGLSVAWACLKRGARVRVIDPRGVAAGSSGGVVGALAPHTPDKWNAKKAFQLESLTMAPAFWAEVAAVSGLPTGYAATGRLQPLADERAADLARSREADARANWSDAARWHVIDAARAGGWAPPSPTGLLIHDTLSALLHPRQATRALAEAIRVRGGQILLGDSAAELPQHSPEVWATGHEGLEAMNTALALQGRRTVGAGVKGQALTVALPDALRPGLFNSCLSHPGLPQLFVDGMHLIPHLDGTLAIGSTTERYFEDPASTDAQLDTLHQRAVAALPELGGAPVLERWAGVRPRARSRAPMLGAHPLQPGVHVANGGFKIGFGMAPLIGEVMADLILEGRDRIPDDFRVSASL